MIPVIFSPFGSICKPAHEYFTKKVFDAKGQNKVARFFKVISFSFARAMAFRLRRGAGFIPFDPPTSTNKPTTQAVARGCDPHAIPPEFLTAPAFRQEHLHPKVRAAKAKRLRSNSPPRAKKLPKSTKQPKKPARIRESTSCRHCKQTPCRQGAACKVVKQKPPPSPPQAPMVPDTKAPAAPEVQQSAPTPPNAADSPVVTQPASTPQRGRRNSVKPLQVDKTEAPSPLRTPSPSKATPKCEADEDVSMTPEGAVEGALYDSHPSSTITSHTQEPPPQRTTSPLRESSVHKSALTTEVEGDAKMAILTAKVQRGTPKRCHADCAHLKFPSQRKTHDIFCPRSKKYVRETAPPKPVPEETKESEATNDSQKSETTVLAKRLSVLGYPVRGPDKKTRQPKPSHRASFEGTEETSDVEIGYSAPSSVRQLKRKAAHQLPEGPNAVFQPTRPPPFPLTRSRPAGKK